MQAIVTGRSSTAQGHTVIHSARGVQGENIEQVTSICPFSIPGQHLDQAPSVSSSELLSHAETEAE